MMYMSERLRKMMDELKINNAETYYHSIRVKSFVLKMIDLLKKEDIVHYTREETEAICKGALLHDIGKLTVNNVILTKDTSLTEDEKKHMSHHTQAGFELVRDELGKMEYEIVRNICLYHHERADGNVELPLYMTIVSLCDVYDALRSDRCYREALTYEKAMDFIQRGECGFFDEKMVEYLKKITSEEE